MIERIKPRKVFGYRPSSRTLRALGAKLEDNECSTMHMSKRTSDGGSISTQSTSVRCVCGKKEMDGVRCRFGASHVRLKRKVQ